MYWMIKSHGTKAHKMQRQQHATCKNSQQNVRMGNKGIRENKSDAKSHKQQREKWDDEKRAKATAIPTMPKKGEKKNEREEKWRNRIECATKNCLLQNVLMQKMPCKNNEYDIQTRPDHKVNIFLAFVLSRARLNTHTQRATIVLVYCLSVMYKYVCLHRQTIEFFFTVTE